MNLDNLSNVVFGDADWNQEDDFYEWLQGHLSVHQSIINRLGL